MKEIAEAFGISVEELRIKKNRGIINTFSVLI